MNLEQTAQKARRDFEDWKICENELRVLYSKYHPINDFDTFFESAKFVFPKLNCGLASVYLQKLIPETVIVQGKYLDNNHTFLVVYKKTIIDITSDQYGGPKVYVGAIKEPWSINIS